MKNFIRSNVFLTGVEKAALKRILAAKAAKTINSPEFQISKALAETGGAGARLAAKAGDVGANVGSQAGQGVEHMENEDDQQ